MITSRLIKGKSVTAKGSVQSRSLTGIQIFSSSSNENDKKRQCHILQWKRVSFTTQWKWQPVWLKQWLRAILRPVSRIEITSALTSYTGQLLTLDWFCLDFFNWKIAANISGAKLKLGRSGWWVVIQNHRATMWPSRMWRALSSVETSPCHLTTCVMIRCRPDRTNTW